jgi:hypothetical protein
MSPAQMSVVDLDGLPVGVVLAVLVLSSICWNARKLAELVTAIYRGIRKLRLTGAVVRQLDSQTLKPGDLARVVEAVMDMPPADGRQGEQDGSDDGEAGESSDCGVISFFQRWRKLDKPP